MLTISEFARLGQVSARMLRHYDIMGLLRPLRVGEENGYRYYDAAQLGQLRRIEALKSYGFALAEIRELLPLDEAALAERIHARRLAAYRELSELRRTLRLMEEQIMKMEVKSMAQEKYPIIIMEDPEQRVFGIRRTINISETGALFDEVLKEAEKRGLKRAGPMQQIFLGEEYNYDALDLDAQIVISGDHPDVRILPACTCVATTHTGPYESIHFAYEAIGTWMSEHPEYVAAGPGIERYLRDEGMVNSPEELETGILFPIKKIK